jgi:hypothetical protein
MLLEKGCTFLDIHKLLTDLVQKSENDVYVFDKEGWIRHIEPRCSFFFAWKPSAGMVLYPNVTLFNHVSSGLCGSFMKWQTVLLLQKNAVFGESVSTTCCETSTVRDFRTEKCQQVWFF